MAEGSADSTTLENTSTWAVATVCFFMVAVSLLIEHSLHLLAKYFHKKRRPYLIQVLDKIRTDLMLWGFISLLLTVAERRIANICIPKSIGEDFLPCRRLTSDEEESSKCEQQGKFSLMSRAGVQQLQILIFVLAFSHVLSCFLTFSLGMAKIGRWEVWEAETRTMDYQFQNDPRRFQLIHQTSFARRHLKFSSGHRFFRLPVSFLRQFYGSVSKVDYLTLRHGFIMGHFGEGSNFNFIKFLRRALEKDFGVVVGLRLWIWILSVLFIFFNAYVFYSYLWLPFIPLVMLLIIGTKLQSTITKMCLDSSDKTHVIKGSLLVRPSDHFFWFGRPKLLLHLMHFILFQNSFQLAFFSYTWYEFGLRSCFHRRTEDIVIRLVMGLLVHILCGYVTLPLYALVTQMGTSMRNTVFPEAVVTNLKKWQTKAKKNIAQRSNYSAHPSLEASIDNSVNNSPSFRTTLDGSISIELDNGFADAFVAVEVSDEESVVQRRPEQGKKLGSFEGFLP